MKWVFAAGAAALAASCVYQGKSERWTVIVGSSLDGQLSPCGCSKPMVGGVRRRAAAVRAIAAQGQTLVLEPGPFVTSMGRQDELKMDAIAEILRIEKGDAAFWGVQEERLGEPMFDAAQRLSEQAFLRDRSGLRMREKGPFVVLAVANTTESLGAARSASAQAASSGKVPIAMLAGDLSAAKALSATAPVLKLVVYRSVGTPPEKPARVGSCLLVSAGDLGKNLSVVTYEGARFESYRVVTLGPDRSEDEDAQRAYGRYLDRVVNQDLLGQVPRGPRSGYVGTEACGKCHGDALASWQASAHSHALKTLENERHDRDPDCVACHVVGLTSIDGFTSRDQTPSLANVGCESCHGAGESHSRWPDKFKLPAGGEKACLPCHTSANSPGFDFESYWAKVIHR